MPMIEAIIEALSMLSEEMFSETVWSNEVQNELVCGKVNLQSSSFNEELNYCKTGNVK